MTYEHNEPVFYSSRKKCLKAMKKAIGHNPVGANVPTGKFDWERWWLYADALTNAIKGNWETKEIAFFGTNANGYYSNKYVIREIEVN